MVTGGQTKADWNLVTAGHVTLERKNTYKDPNYISIVVCQDKIVVLDRDTDKVNIHGLHDGKFLASSGRLESVPRGMCLMDAMTICVLHYNGLIQMISIDSTDMSRDINTTRTLRLLGVFDVYRGVVRFNDSLVVTGVRQGTMYWCIVSLLDGYVDTIHQIYKGDGFSRATTKDNMIYISCHAGYESLNTGVYGFDVLNPSQCKYKYKHQRLQSPSSIVINEDGNIFVCNYGYPSNCIHQLTASCQLVAIFTQGIPWNLQAIFWDNGRLYGTCFRSPDITEFRAVYQENQKDSKVETSIAIEQGNHKIGYTWWPISMVEEESGKPRTEPPTFEELPASYLTYPYRSIMVDEGQSSLEREKPPSGPSPEDSEDGKKGVHKATDIPISDERKQPVIGGISTQIEQEIPIQQSVEEKLNQAEIQMSTEDKNLFLKFQQEIGTTLFFSEGEHTLIDSKESLKAEKFLQENRPDMMDKWLEYTNQGKLTPELIDAIYAKERNPELHDKKDDILGQMKQLNIIVKARSFDEKGVKEDNFFHTPCMLRLETSREDISPEQDTRMLSTSVLCWVFTGTFLPPSIFDGLLAACLARWPVTQKKETSQNLISYGCTVFDLDLTHRLTLNCENHIVYARITWLVIDDIKTPDAKLCTRVRMFISRKLSKITNSLNQNLQYELCLKSQESPYISEDSCIRFSPFQMWFEDEVHDPDSPIKPEHMNHARLCVALVTVCGKALREMLLDNFPVPYIDIYQAILAKHAKLTSRRGRPLLNQEQIKLVFPDPFGQKTGTVETFDLSLLYTLIRNVSTVQAPVAGWGIDPQSGDTSLGASVERIRSYRNHISGHSPDAKINDQDFEDYWKKFKDVLHDIEVVINRKVYSTELERQKRQVISVFDAC